MTSDYAKTLGGRLRSVRTQQGLSLQAVQDRSQGRWKAVVVGSYERGDRAITVERLAELAEFYGVTVAALLPDGGGAPGARPSPAYLLGVAGLRGVDDERAAPLRRYVEALRVQRGGEAGLGLAVTEDDLRALAAIYETPVADLAETLRGWGALADAPAP